MGKTQSKRSVDITTEAKKTPDEDVGKLEKIEDLDQKQLNGDASSQDNAETEKKDGDEIENDKDLTTEKSGGDNGAQDGGGDSNTGQCNTSAAESASKEDESATSKEGNKTAEEISPLADENNKKPKKEKVKKKWSFRSISFGKKDKQKPAKAEDAGTETALATNGEAAAPAGEGAATEETAEKVQKGEAAGDFEAKKSSEKPVENGESSEKELNGEKTSTSTTPTEEKPAKAVASNESATNITNNTTETKNSVENNSTTATENNQTEKQTTTTVTNAAAETSVSTSAVVSNGDANENNGTKTLSTVDDQKDQVKDKAADLMGETSDVTEKIKSIPSVANEASDNNGVHQNGTTVNGEEFETEIESKSQVEVIFQTDQAALTDDLVTLTTATTSSSPKTTPILLPDPNTESAKIETGPLSSESVITELTENQIEETAIAIEPVSTSTFSETVSVVVANVDAGNEEPSESESHDEKQAAQSPVESHCDAEGDVLSTAVSAKSTAQDSPKPPPLPVSPPPSQVSVFAFDDNNQAEEEGICAASTETVTGIETDPTEVPCSDIKSMTDLQSSNEELLSKEDVASEIPSSSLEAASATTAENVHIESNIETISSDVIGILEVTENPIKHVEENSLEELADQELSTTNFPNLTDDIARVPEHTLENNEEEFVKMATTVVDEITEKAIELIQQQKDNSSQPELHEQDELIATKQDLKTENTEINNHSSDGIKNNEILLSFVDAPKQEVITQMESSTIKCDETNSVKTASLAVESHLHDCLKSTDKHLVEEENALATEICSDSVDITIAKDLKESAAAEVTTQDLPVICE